jgi:hypothetical protein
MDGVIADFVKRYKELYGMLPKEAEKHEKFDELFDEFIARRNFATLDLMPGATMGLEYLRRLHVPTEILSSTANKERYDDISQQKAEWLKQHHIDFKQNFVPGKDLKDEFATPHSIIIDDTESVISDWNKAGGIGILHKNWPTTLAILRMYV